MLVFIINILNILKNANIKFFFNIYIIYAYIINVLAYKA